MATIQKAASTGIEPVASSVTGKRSIRLSYDTVRVAEGLRPVWSPTPGKHRPCRDPCLSLNFNKQSKATDGSRTRDRPHTRRVLSRPSSGSYRRRELTREESNLLPPAYQAGALPVSYGSDKKNAVPRRPIAARPAISFTSFRS